MVSAGFVGLLGQATLDLAPAMAYPLGALLAATGFLMTLVMDQTLQSFCCLQVHYVVARCWLQMLAC